MTSDVPEKRRPILAAVDFSPSSAAALAWAVSEARTHQRPLVVLHVVYDPSDAPGFYRRGQGDEDAHAGAESMESAAKRFLQEFMDEFGADNDAIHAVPDVETRLVVGLPATRILEVARDCDARQIVTGSRGRTGIAHLLVGSVAQRVVQLSPVPVTIVKADRHPAVANVENDEGDGS